MERAEIPESGYDVPDDADPSQVPDANYREADRADNPDPAFDEIDDDLEAPVEGEDDFDEPELDDELAEMLDADEHIDPEESAEPIPPEVGEAAEDAESDYNG